MFWCTAVSSGRLSGWTASGLSATTRRAINLACREAGLAVGQLHVDARKFNRHPGSAKGSMAAEVLQFLGRGATGHLQRRPYGPRRNAIDANTFFCELLRQR